MLGSRALVFIALETRVLFDGRTYFDRLELGGEPLDDRAIQQFPIANRVDHERLGPAARARRCNRHRDAPARADVLARRRDRANLSPMTVFLEPLFQPIAQIEIADFRGYVRVFFGNAFFETAFADEHEARVRPLRFNRLHDCLREIGAGGGTRTHDYEFTKLAL